jgi:hypothetical protein
MAAMVDPAQRTAEIDNFCTDFAQLFSKRVRSECHIFLQEISAQSRILEDRTLDTTEAADELCQTEEHKNNCGPH